MRNKRFAWRRFGKTATTNGVLLGRIDEYAPWWVRASPSDGDGIRLSIFERARLNGPPSISSMCVPSTGTSETCAKTVGPDEWGSDEVSGSSPVPDGIVGGAIRQSRLAEECNATGEIGSPLHDGLRVRDPTSPFPGRSFVAVNVPRCPACGREWRCKR